MRRARLRVAWVVVGLLAAAGLVEVETYVEIGDDKDRLYILAQRP